MSASTATTAPPTASPTPARGSSPTPADALAPPRSPTLTSAVQLPSGENDGSQQAKPATKTRAFWFSIVALMFSTLLSALDLTAVSTALPTIATQLHAGDDYIWVGSAYSLASTAILPLSGALSDAFGRRPVLLMFITLFGLGSALAGAAQNMNMMIGARSKPHPYRSLTKTIVC
jgi:hypothetical protein